jgi:hypothetical protein
MIESPPPSVISCPVLDCGWTTDASGPPPESTKRETLADAFGPGVYAAVAVTQNAWRLERELDQHFRQHSTADYVRTMAQQRAELEAQTKAYGEANRYATRLYTALVEIATELRVQVPVNQDLDELTKAMRAAVMRLAHGQPAASGRGWGQ